MKDKLTALLTRPLAVIGALFIAIVAGFTAAPGARDYFISTLVVYPAADENGTNTVRVVDKTGTNWWAIAPTNAQQLVRWQGTNYTALMNTNLFLTNGGVAYPVKIRNGLWVN